MLNKIFLKRILSSIIDLCFSFLPVTIAFYGRNIWEYFIIISFIIYVIHTSILIIISQNTIGEKLLKIHIVYNKHPKLMALLRNLLFGLLIFLPLLPGNDKIELLFALIPLIGLFPIFGDKKGGDVLNGLDVIFKLNYNNN